jgi:hypothetical protein
MTDIIERLRLTIGSAQLPWRTKLFEIVRDDPNDDEPWTVARCNAAEGSEETIVAVMNATPFLLDTIQSLQAEVSALREGLRNIESAEKDYRWMHDTLGGGNAKTGRAWDLMRRYGDRARALLEGNDNENRTI